MGLAARMLQTVTGPSVASFLRFASQTVIDYHMVFEHYSLSLLIRLPVG